MSELFDSYLAQVDEQIRWPRVRPALRRELMGHLEEQRDACLADGMDESSAEVEAVRQMGDPVLIGQQLDAVHRPRPQYAPLALAAILAICGALIRIHIGGSSPARSIAAAALGFLLLLVAYFSDYRRLVRYGGWIYLATVVLGYAARQWWPWIFQSGRLFQYVSLLFPLAGTLAACALRGKRRGFWLAGLAYGLLLWLSYRMTYALGTLLLIGFVGGIVFWGGFNTGMEKANTEEFCISCHEMRNTVYQEYMDSVHYNNRSGVRATCPDCHVPHEFVPKMIRKLKASKELYGKIFGVIDTPQKFEAHRLTMAQNEWRRMKDNNSQECRNCHNFEYMDTTAQKSVAAKMHDQAVKDGQTCIDCHKGIAHKLPDMREVEPGF